MKTLVTFIKFHPVIQMASSDQIGDYHWLNCSWKINDFEKYVFQALWFRIQHNVVNESVHKTTSAISLIDVSAWIMESTNRANIFAPNSSSCGIVCLLIGATHVLDAIKFTSISPLLCVVRRYTTAANARSDASQNLWILCVRNSSFRHWK
jgi:hypothetical protein